MKSLFDVSGEQIKSYLEGKRTLDIAVIHLTFEGIQTFGGGVCSVTRGHLDALEILKRKFSKYKINLVPYFCEIAYAKDHERRDTDYEDYARKKISAMGGEVVLLTNFTQGYLPKAPWGVGDLGTTENWKAAGASGASAALNIAFRHKASIIYCHDSLYSFAPLYISLQADAFGADVMSIFIIHSTALTHELPLPNPERLMAESATIHWAKISSRVKLGYISKFMRNHIVKDYGAAAQHMVPAGNGINPENPLFRQRTQEEIAKKLKEYKIPLDKNLFISWGRSVAYKKYDVNLKAAARLNNKIYPVIIVTPEYPELEKLAQELGIEARFVYTFDPELIASLCQWKKTAAAGILAKMEPCGLIPMEMRMYARNTGGLLIVSDTGGLKEQVDDGVDGFISKQDDDKDVARIIKNILDLPERKKEKIRANGFQTIVDNYTWTTQIVKTLSASIPSLNFIINNVRQEITAEDRKKFK